MGPNEKHFMSILIIIFILSVLNTAFPFALADFHYFTQLFARFFR